VKRARGEHRAVYLFMGAAMAVLALGNLWLFREVRGLQRSGGSLQSGRPEQTTPGDTPFRLLLVFSPTDCSAYYSAELATWERLAQELPPDRVSVEIVACYTNEKEFEAWRRDAGVVLRRVKIDPHCRRVVDSKDGDSQISTPLKLLIGVNGDILYREGPTSDPALNLALRDKIWDFIRNDGLATDERGVSR
jgi:hypothetical protein